MDELEQGLEPHRIIRLLGSLGAKEKDPPLQVFMTTHSPVALRELSGDQLFVVRPGEYKHEVLTVGIDDDIQSTIRMVREARPDDVGVSVSYPLPGTKFFNLVEAQLGPKQNWEDSDDLAMMFQGAYRSEFYRALRDALHREVAGAREQEMSALWQQVEALEKSCGNRVLDEEVILIGEIEQRLHQSGPRTLSIFFFSVSALNGLMM